LGGHFRVSVGRFFHSLGCLWIDLLSAEQGGAVEEGLVRGTALGSVALIGTLTVVELEVTVEVGLELIE
jgi:hypothetical protein